MSNYLVCRVGDEAYVIPLAYVQEVLQMVALHDVPDPSVLGMMTLRDHVMPVLDLRPHLQLPPIEISMQTPIVAINHEGQHLGIVVDDIEGVLDFDAAESTYQQGIIQRTLKVENRILFELNLATLLQSLSMIEG